MMHHPKCAARKAPGLCTKPCSVIQRVIDEFNDNDYLTHRSHPDSREHYYARFPILAEDCDYEIVGFSGVQGKGL